ncbi:ABC transporter substrate-binding protein [Gordoniibacillus kamchatkensis]|uniref:ABC transporter substrate-binding protein n=1 Tax=Gordoniibacillus kamchatkensis TaxID=1590651 RepID=A0ABR5AB48_9BACL|nr:metal ABC transporter substrate-binding protein [Paenibacillus sp. VKM B-2647]KIL38195.1 ABC transporter substrate-binding protein [Paenibacillus sp. VKM B-2647]
MFIRKFRFAAIAAAALIIAAALLGGCSQTVDRQLDPHKLNVVASFYPLYDFATKIGGDHVHVVNLVPAGVEPHDWSPKSRDLQLLGRSQVFVYEGIGFEGWADNALKTLKADGPVVVEAGKGVPLLQAAEDDGHDVKDGGEAGESKPGADPHIWLSPANAKIIGANIKQAFIQADPAHKQDYEANYANFASKLDALDAKYKQQLGGVKQKQLVVSHQAFGYLCRDYGLTQMPIMGLAPDAEPTAQEMKKINDFIKQNNVKTIFFEELVSDKLAKTLAKDAGVGTAVLNPLEGLTEQQQKAGQDYFSVMETNLQHLVQALQ